MRIEQRDSGGRLVRTRMVGAGPKRAPALPASAPEPLVEWTLQRARETGRLVVIYSNAPWGVGGGAQPPQAHADILAREAAVVHLAWGNPEPEAPMDSGVVVRRARELAAFLALGAKRRFFYAGAPDGAAVAGLRQARDLGWGTGYYCFDDWGQWEWAKGKWYEEAQEAALVQEADLVLCTARLLVERMERHADRGDMRHLPNSTRIVGQEWAKGKRTVDCVCVGWLADSWPDWGLFEALAKRWTLRVIGRLPEKLPFESANVEWVGQVPVEDLMPLLSTAKVGVIPFRDIPLVHAVDPIKYYDYLAAGLPTVASYMPELEGRPFATVAWSEGAFVDAVGEALRKRWKRQEIREEAARGTDEERVKVLKEWMEELGAW